MDWIEVAGQIIKQCRFPDYNFVVEVDGRGAVYLQGSYWEADTVSGEVELQYTRRWFLSPAMSNSEIVQTAFKCVMTSMEHKAREWFTWKDRAIFQPHPNIDKLYEICEDRVVRA